LGPGKIPSHGLFLPQGTWQLDPNPTWNEESLNWGRSWDRKRNRFLPAILQGILGT
jgi:hypothetical protein